MVVCEMCGVLCFQCIGYVVVFEQVFLVMKDGGQVCVVVDVDDVQCEVVVQDVGLVGFGGNQCFLCDVWWWGKNGLGVW